ncbi:MAG TPA: phosphopantetheine-binding protein, partial [Myxococcales bacterium]|nr:phosphopantetheine-binding protein [Myxococcales bacterium]
WADPGAEGPETLWDGLASRSSGLASAAEGWARLLASRGGAGKPVAVKLSPSPARAAAVLGVLRAGAVLAADGAAELELKDGDAPAPSGDPGPVPAGDAPALRAGSATVTHRTLARSFLGLAERTGVQALDSVWDGLEAGQDGWWMPALLCAASGAAAGGSRPTVVLAPPQVIAEQLPQRPKAWLLCAGHPSRKLRAALAAHAAPAFAVLVPDAAGVPVAAGRVEAGTEGRSLFGRPFSGLQVRVLDGNQEVVPVNAPGRLVVGDTATAERARFLAGGAVEHLGRTDGQVHFRGKLVSTDALARALSGHPAIADSAVRRLEDRDGEEKLVAYVAPRPGELFTETELRAEARKASPVAPQLFVELESLPRDARGAVDDDRLPYPFSRTAGHDFQPARSASEKLLSTLWQNALQVPRVSVYENFFDLGGYSLLCFQVLAEVKARTGLSLSPRTMLLGTLEQVAAELDAAGKPAAAPPPVPQEGGGGLLDKLRGWTKR